MRIEFLVEEPSMKALLDRVLPQVVSGAEWEVFDFRSKEQLLKQLPGRLRGYAQMIHRAGYADLRVLVLVDRDDDDCTALKARLEADVATAGLRSLTAARAAPAGLADPPFHVVTRVVCEELEAWYFGDPAACQAAYHRLKRNSFTPVHLQHPDAVKGGTWEAFGRALHSAGHLPVPRPLSNRWKYEAAERIGAHLDPPRNASPSFQAFVAGVRALLAAAT